MDEAALLNHYNITALYPNEWPAEKDESSDEDDQEPPKAANNTGHKRTRSRYGVLGKRSSFRKLSSSSTARENVEGLVQKDEPDPLGVLPSVVQKLRQRGIPVEDDIKTRNRFLLSSTTFSPTLFLSQVHSEASTESLLQGLDFLSRSIEKKSASLKVLVESNFERFVRAKMTIDNVYTEMREQGHNPAPARPTSRRESKALHLRNTSMTGTTNRRKPSISSPFSPGLLNKPLPSDAKKNALTKESEYGVQGIKAPLIEVAVKAEEVWGPALGGREKEETLRSVLASIEKNRAVFEIGSLIQDCIKRNDHDMLIEEYTKARRYADEAKTIVETAVQSQISLSEPDVHQVIVTARMWSDVDGQIALFKRDLWRKLAGTHFSKQPTAEEDRPEEHIELIRILLELGVEDNPIWVWLLSRYDFLKGRIRAMSERSKVEIEILRRHLANGERPDLTLLASNLISVSNHGKPGVTVRTDSPQILEFWEHVLGSINLLMSTKGGILGEVMEFWDTAQSFIEGKAQKKLPIGFDGQSRQHHRLSTDGVRDLRAGALELIEMIRDHIVSFFSEGPIEDISMLFSPSLPVTPLSPRTPMTATLSPLSDTRFKFDVNRIPPPSPRRGESWEKYAFWPPHATATSGAEYLSKIVTIIGTAASEMANLSLLRDTDQTNLKGLVGGVRERCVQAVCAAWATDADNYKVIEDWTRSGENRELTNLPNRFLGLESYILVTLQKLLYISDATSRSGAPEVIVPPSTKLLQIVRTQFMGSVYKTISGMVENVDKPIKLDDDIWDEDDDDLAVSTRNLSVADSSVNNIDPSRRTIRILMTLSNLHAFRNDVVPKLISLFETNFSVSLTEETTQVQSALGQIDTRLFQEYSRPLAQKLSNAVEAGVLHVDWPPPTPQEVTDARPYVYEVLLELVIVHTEVSTTAASLAPPILEYLLVEICAALIKAFQQRQSYTLAALMQATLDVEFIAQTLTIYTTQKATDTQSAIYFALDERTDNDARMKLQTGLTELRSILKKLRERTKAEFGCFKRPRGQGNKGERPASRP